MGHVLDVDSGDHEGSAMLISTRLRQPPPWNSGSSMSDIAFGMRQSPQVQRLLRAKRKKNRRIKQPEKPNVGFSVRLISSLEQHDGRTRTVSWGFPRGQNSLKRDTGGWNFGTRPGAT